MREEAVCLSHRRLLRRIGDALAIAVLFNLDRGFL